MSESTSRNGTEWAWKACALLTGGACMLALAIAPGTAAAATITVNTTSDVHGTPGNCSLREAISSANNDVVVGNCREGDGQDLILIPGGTYALAIPRGAEGVLGTVNATGDLDLTDPATLRPRSPLERVIVDANGSATDDRVMQTTAVGDGVVLSGLTLRDGVSDFGAGIFQGGDLRLDRVTLTGNRSEFNGAGIFVDGGTLTTINSTISGNRTNFSGGGIRVGPGADAATLENTTIADNVADNDLDGDGSGGGIFSSSPTSLADTLIAGNTDRGGEAPDCESSAGPVVSTGQTLLGTVQGCTDYTAGPGDITGVAPGLRGLAFNGGTAATRALRPNSPARNRGNGCPATDQRGLPRRFGGRCDIGAYEYARCGAKVINRVGTPGANSLTGTRGGDGVAALAGNDRVFTGPGRDWVCAGAGRDRVFTRAGVDRAFGGRGADRLVGGRGADRLFGGRGSDTLLGLGGRPDRCFGGGGLDGGGKGCEIVRSIP